MADVEKSATKGKKMPVRKKQREEVAEPKETQGKEVENLRKSRRLKQNEKLTERMKMFVMETKKDLNDSSELEESDHDDDEFAEPANKKPKKSPVKTPKKTGRPKKKQTKKQSSSDEEEEEEEKSPAEDDPNDKDFNLEMLDLRPVGDTSRPKNSVPLNKRGMPQRVRKKNKLFFDDNVVNPFEKKDKDKTKKNEKKAKKTEKDNDEKAKVPLDARELNTMRQRIGAKLRNLLKLPKAQKWVYYEFFYSNIDRVLFCGSNDFLVCLKESFGHLRSQQMTRTEWKVVRRLMGKPRRCSQSFFREERATLERRRNIIRQIQLRKIKDASQCRDLPDRIPLQLSINARVTAKLRTPQSGLFTGKVDAVDPSNHTYRITFDRPGIGTHSIPDYEVLLNGEPDMVSISAMHKRYLSSKLHVSHKSHRNDIVWPPMKDPKEIWMERAKTAALPRQFYEMIVRICKILKEKRQKIQMLRHLNGEAEKMLSLGEEYPLRFQQRYASLLIELESLNISLNRYLAAVQKYCHAVAPDVCAAVSLAPSYVREKSIADANATMKAYFKDKEPLSEEISLLVVELMALVLQLQNLTRPKASTQDRLVLKQTLQKIKLMISPNNRLSFQNLVEVHVKYIEAAFSDDNPLSALLAQKKSNDVKA